MSFLNRACAVLAAVAALGMLGGCSAEQAEPEPQTYVASGDFPTKFDLREKGIVSPVKNQMPFGTCGAFSAIASAEISVMNDRLKDAGGDVYEGEVVDFSERQLAWFENQTISPEVSKAQAGEGIHAMDLDGNDVDAEEGMRMSLGGFDFSAAGLMEAGTGPILEGVAPYKNEEGLTRAPTSTTPASYAPEGTWSLDDSLRGQHEYLLEEWKLLPSPAEVTDDKEYTFNPAAIDTIKEQLMDGVAPTAFFRVSTDRKSNEHQYAQKPHNIPDHAVEIVGWDDDYPADRFAPWYSSTPQGEEAEAAFPLANGAFLAKDSQGSSHGEFPDYDDVGLDEDGDGLGDGYIWISYYDKSLMEPQTFKFSSDEEALAESRIVAMHDYMPAEEIYEFYSGKDECSTANVFTADEDMQVRYVSCRTGSPDVDVTFDVYLLREGWTSPTDGDLAFSGSEKYEYAGFHRMSIPDGVKVDAGRQYSIVVKQKSSETGDFLMTASRASNKEGTLKRVADGDISLVSLKQFYKDQPVLLGYCVGVVNPGESFVMRDGSWSDWVDEVGEVSTADDKAKLFSYDNFPIKAFGEPTQ